MKVYVVTSEMHYGGGEHPVISVEGVFSELHLAEAANFCNDSQIFIEEFTLDKR